MKIEEFNTKLIDDLFLSNNQKDPYDSTLFLRNNIEWVCRIANIIEFEILSINIPKKGVHCDGFLIDEEEGILSIILAEVSKNKINIEKITEKGITRLLNTGINFVDHALDNTIINDLDESEEQLISALNLIFNFKTKLNEINFYIVTNKLFPIHSKIRKPEGKIGNIKYSSTVISLHDFFNFWKIDNKVDEKPYLNFRTLGYKLPLFIQLPKINADYEGYLVIISARVLFDLYNNYDTALLQSNVRFYLNAARKENKGMLTTLENSGQMFFAYNNGISAVADSIKLTTEGNEICINEVENFQIVNGGQTTATIHLFGEQSAENLKKLDNVFIQMKLNIIKNKRNRNVYIEDISKYANTQSKVNVSDLDANDKFNEDFESYSKKTIIPNTNGEKWFYERKTGAYFTNGINLGRVSKVKEIKFHNEFKKERVIKKTELALILFAWGFYEGSAIDPRPYDSALGGEKNYMKFKTYRDVRKITVDELFYKESIAKLILANEIEILVDKSGIKQQRNHIVHYTMSLISLINNGKINFDSIWFNQTISEQFQIYISYIIKEVWTLISKHAHEINLSTWCRKEECWKELKGLKKKINSNSFGTIPELRNSRSAKVFHSVKQLSKKLKTQDIYGEIFIPKKFLVGKANGFFPDPEIVDPKPKGKEPHTVSLRINGSDFELYTFRKKVHGNSDTRFKTSIGKLFEGFKRNKTTIVRFTKITEFEFSMSIYNKGDKQYAKINSILKKNKGYYVS